MLTKNWHFQLFGDHKNFLIARIKQEVVLESGLINFLLQKFWFSAIASSVNDIITQDSMLESSLANFSSLNYRIVENTK